MTLMSTKEHLIFDIDGTLWNSTEKVAEAFNSGIANDPRVASVYPLSAERLRQEFGRPLHEIGYHLFPMLSSSESDILIDHLCDLENRYLASHPPCPYPGVSETIHSLAEKNDLYIVSNCNAGYAEVFLETTGLSDCFRDHLCPGDTGLLKADNISLLAAKYEMPRVWYIGDTDMDRVAAREAGARFIHAAYGFGQVREADAVISCFSDLRTLFAE